MRPFPSVADYGRWDALPDGPTESHLNWNDPHIADLLARRARLTQHWAAMVTYPHGVWSAAAIANDPTQAEAWRNWFTRRAWEGITMLNSQLTRLAREAEQAA